MDNGLCNELAPGTPEHGAGMRGRFRRVLRMDGIG
jgi:hypothetical protein